MFAEALRRHLMCIELELSDRQITQLEHHFNFLTRWNKILNLTAIEDLEETVQRHYCESLFLGRHLPNRPLKILDVGSGAGFPGIPVAVLRPDCTVCLVESHQRKGVFLRESTRSLANLSVISKRVEAVSGTFDWGVVRGIRYRDIEPSLNRLTPNVALLAGEGNPNERFTWNKIKLPWGQHRFLWLRSSL